MRLNAFESSRRDLHNALLFTALRSQFFVKIAKNFAELILQNAAKLTKFEEKKGKISTACARKKFLTKN